MEANQGSLQRSSKGDSRGSSRWSSLFSRRHQKIFSIFSIVAFLLVLINHDIATEPIHLLVSASETLFLQDYVAAVKLAVERARADPYAPNVIPLLIIPTMHDGDVLPQLLRSIDTPVRQFFFAWNSADADLGVIFSRLQKALNNGSSLNASCSKTLSERSARGSSGARKGDGTEPILVESDGNGCGVAYAQNTGNFGFSGSINKGLSFARSGMMQPEPLWYFIVNSDVSFPPGSLGTFATTINTDPNRHRVGTFYGSYKSHHAFAVTKEAVDAAGTMDENFYPAYYEDVDWRWRINLAGFDEVVVQESEMFHQVSVNLHRGGVQKQSMKRRGGIGLFYGASKWGRVNGKLDYARYPYSNFTTPFNIPNFSLATWVLDKERIECIKTGVGTRHPESDVCWYNGTKYLAAAVGGDLQRLPKHLREPTPKAYEM
jgi:hypothetical protein